MEKLGEYVIIWKSKEIKEDLQHWIDAIRIEYPDGTHEFVSVIFDNSDILTKTS